MDLNSRAFQEFIGAKYFKAINSPSSSSAAIRKPKACDKEAEEFSFVEEAEEHPNDASPAPTAPVSRKRRRNNAIEDDSEEEGTLPTPPKRVTTADSYPKVADGPSNGSPVTFKGDPNGRKRAISIFLSSINVMDGCILPKKSSLTNAEKMIILQALEVALAPEHYADDEHYLEVSFARADLRESYSRLQQDALHLHRRQLAPSEEEVATIPEENAAPSRPLIEAFFAYARDTMAGLNLWVMKRVTLFLRGKLGSTKSIELYAASLFGRAEQGDPVAIDILRSLATMNASLPDLDSLLANQKPGRRPESLIWPEPYTLGHVLRALLAVDAEYRENATVAGEIVRCYYFGLMAASEFSVTEKAITLFDACYGCYRIAHVCQQTPRQLREHTNEPHVHNCPHELPTISKETLCAMKLQVCYNATTMWKQAVPSLKGLCSATQLQIVLQRKLDHLMRMPLIWLSTKKINMEQARNFLLTPELLFVVTHYAVGEESYDTYAVPFCSTEGMADKLIADHWPIKQCRFSTLANHFNVDLGRFQRVIQDYACFHKLVELEKHLYEGASDQAKYAKAWFLRLRQCYVEI